MLLNCLCSSSFVCPSDYLHIERRSEIRSEVVTRRMLIPGVNSLCVYMWGEEDVLLTGVDPFVCRRCETNMQRWWRWSTPETNWNWTRITSRRSYLHQVNHQISLTPSNLWTFYRVLIVKLVPSFVSNLVSILLSNLLQVNGFWSWTVRTETLRLCWRE